MYTNHFLYSDISALYYETIKNELIIFHRTNLIIIRDELQALYNKYNTQYSLTFDCWTASNQDEYMSITIHYINEQWQLQSKLIEMKNLIEKHLVKYLLNVLKSCLFEYDIEDKILSLVFFFFIK